MRHPFDRLLPPRSSAAAHVRRHAVPSGTSSLLMLVASIPTLLRGAHAALIRGSHGAAGRELAADAGFAGVGRFGS